MKEEIDVMKGNINQLCEAMMDLLRKEDNFQMVAGARNIGFTSRQIPEVADPEFGYLEGYTTLEGVTSVVPRLVGIPMVNLVSQEHFIASAR